MSWRRLHRWVAIAAAVFLANMAITGTLLAWSSIGDARREASRATFDPRLPEQQLVQLVRAAYETAHQATGDAPVLSVRVGMAAGEPRGAAVIGGEHSGMLFLDPVRRSYLIGPAGEHAPGDAPLDSHSFLKRLHRGDVFGAGMTGRYVMILSGFCMLYLLVSALVMYLQLRAARTRIGRSGWFWH